jgi:hypothetical protein
MANNNNGEEPGHVMDRIGWMVGIKTGGPDPITPEQVQNLISDPPLINGVDMAQRVRHMLITLNMFMDLMNWISFGDGGVMRPWQTADYEKWFSTPDVLWLGQVMKWVEEVPNIPTAPSVVERALWNMNFNRRRYPLLPAVYANAPTMEVPSHEVEAASEIRDLLQSSDNLDLVDPHTTGQFTLSTIPLTTPDVQWPLTDYTQTDRETLRNAGLAAPGDATPADLQEQKDARQAALNAKNFTREELETMTDEELLKHLEKLQEEETMLWRMDRRTIGNDELENINWTRKELRDMIEWFRNPIGLTAGILLTREERKRQKEARLKEIERRRQANMPKPPDVPAFGRPIRNTRQDDDDYEPPQRGSWTMPDNKDTHDLGFPRPGKTNKDIDDRRKFEARVNQEYERRRIGEVQLPDPYAFDPANLPPDV